MGKFKYLLVCRDIFIDNSVYCTFYADRKQIDGMKSWQRSPSSKPIVRATSEHTLQTSDANLAQSKTLKHLTTRFGAGHQFIRSKACQLIMPAFVSLTPGPRFKRATAMNCRAIPNPDSFHRKIQKNYIVLWQQGI